MASRLSWVISAESATYNSSAGSRKPCWISRMTIMDPYNWTRNRVILSYTEGMGEIWKQYSPTCKARVVLELLRETRSVSELAAEYAGFTPRDCNVGARRPRTSSRRCLHRSRAAWTSSHV